MNAQPAAAFAWNAAAYAQDQSFASTFSSVNATRTAETPASDQFAVPATAFGGAWTGTWRHADGARTSGGADARYVRGETRENYTFTNGAFTRQRVAGGEQNVAGIFGLHERPLMPALRLTLGARIDTWSESDGHRRENDRGTGAVFATTTTRTATAPSSVPAPAWFGRWTRISACAPTSSRRSADPR